jgi:hypothetical protein
MTAFDAAAPICARRLLQCMSPVMADFVAKLPDEDDE